MQSVSQFGLQVNTLLYSIIFVFFTMAIIWFLPKITKALPSTLVAILFTTVLALTLKIDIPNVGDLASVKGGLPRFFNTERTFKF